MSETRQRRVGSGRREGDRRQSGGPVPGLAARQGASTLLSQVLDQGRMLDEAALPAALTPPERAEAQRLADLALRRLGQIDAILAGFAPKRPSAAALAVLRVMTAAIVFARTAPHAAVDLAVRQAKANKRTAKLAGLVNALGRRVAAEGTGIAEAQDAAGLNTPDWLAEALGADWGEAARSIAEAHLVPAPLDLTPADPATAAALAKRLDGRLLPTGTIRLARRPQISALPGYEAGLWWPQDAAAALPARMLGVRAGERVLDLCAAPGGKTLQLAVTGADVTALDVSGRRLERLAENLARTGLEATVVEADARTWEPEAPFDAILLDAPCSATGTIRRHPDLPWRTDASAAEALAALQETLLDRAFSWLRPGGRMVYAVCSLLRAEGEARVATFLERRPGATREPATDLPAGLCDGQGCLRTRPDLWAEAGGLDGFFAARIRRDG